MLEILPETFYVVYSCLEIVGPSLISNLFLSLNLIFFFGEQHMCRFCFYTFWQLYSLIMKFSMFTFSVINDIIVFITCSLFYVGYLFYFTVVFFFFLLFSWLYYIHVSFIFFALLIMFYDAFQYGDAYIFNPNSNNLMYPFSSPY